MCDAARQTDDRGSNPCNDVCPHREHRARLLWDLVRERLGGGRRGDTDGSDANARLRGTEDRGCHGDLLG